VTVASPKVAVRRALFQAGEEATNQVCAESYVTTTSNPSVEATKQRVVDQPISERASVPSQKATAIKLSMNSRIARAFAAVQG